MTNVSIFKKYLLNRYREREVTSFYEFVHLYKVSKSIAKRVLENDLGFKFQKSIGESFVLNFNIEPLNKTTFASRILWEQLRIACEVDTCFNTFENSLFKIPPYIRKLILNLSYQEPLLNLQTNLNTKALIKINKEITDIMNKYKRFKRFKRIWSMLGYKTKDLDIKEYLYYYFHLNDIHVTFLKNQKFNLLFFELKKKFIDPYNEKSQNEYVIQTMNKFNSLLLDVYTEAKTYDNGTNRISDFAIV